MAQLLSDARRLLARGRGPSATGSATQLRTEPSLLQPRPWPGQNPREALARLGEAMPAAPASPNACVRPDPCIGTYFVTPKFWSSIRCKAYTEPPLPDCAGSYITTLASGTYFGPAEEIVTTKTFVTILVRGYWINVWRINDFPRLTGPWTFSDLGTAFARHVPKETVASWRARGWRDT